MSYNCDCRKTPPPKTKFGFKGVFKEIKTFKSFILTENCRYGVCIYSLLYCLDTWCVWAYVHVSIFVLVREYVCESMHLYYCIRVENFPPEQIHSKGSREYWEVFIQN